MLGWVIAIPCLVLLLIALVVTKIVTTQSPYVTLPFAIRWDLTKRLLYQLVRGQFKRMPDYLPPEVENVKDHKFITAWDAARVINDGDTCLASGFAGYGRNFLMFYTVRDLFKKTGHPRDLRWVTISAQGGRGKLHGTIEEFAAPGLLKEYAASHHETAYALLKAAQKGQFELHTFPLGAASQAYAAQGRGDFEYDTYTGVGTRLDPRVGMGSAVKKGDKNKYIFPVPGDDEKLRLVLPRLNVSFVAAPFADVEGNIYFRDAANISDLEVAARACHANNGTVIAIVSGIIDKNEEEIGIPTNIISHVVVHPLNEQVAFHPHTNPTMDFLPKGTGSRKDEVDPEIAFGKYTWVNKILKVTADRTPAERAIGYAATDVFIHEVPKGSMINIGVGLGEELGNTLWRRRMHTDYVQTTESGVYGGIPIPGAWFGGAIQPKMIKDSAWMFDQYNKSLDCAVLGFLEVDSDGNVNVSNRGDNVRQFIGPGGFADITSSAKTIIFVGSWMGPGGKTAVTPQGHLNITKRGVCKFVDKVREITFSGQTGLKRGKTVYYCTHVGIFKLLKEGVTLVKVFPGIDIERDIKKMATAKIIIPDSPEVISTDTVQGKY